MTEESLSGPRSLMVSIIFRKVTSPNFDTRVTRHWYHVPRVGDVVELLEPDGNGGWTSNVVLSGEVGSVSWGDEYVLVHVR